MMWFSRHELVYVLCVFLISVATANHLSQSSQRVGGRSLRVVPLSSLNNRRMVVSRQSSSRRSPSNSFLSSLLGVNLSPRQENTVRQLLLRRLFGSSRSQSSSNLPSPRQRPPPPAPRPTPPPPPPPTNPPPMVVPQNQGPRQSLGQGQVQGQGQNPLVIEANGQIKVSEVRGANGQSHVIIDASQNNRNLGGIPTPLPPFPTQGPLKPGEDPPERDLLELANLLGLTGPQANTGGMGGFIKK